MLPGRPLGLWFVNELLYWLASSLAYLKDTNNKPRFIPPPPPPLFIPFWFYAQSEKCGQKGGGGCVGGCYYRMLLYMWLKSSGLSSVFPPLLWLLFFSTANLYCVNLRQLSNAQWCKRTNLMPPLPHLEPPTQAGHGPGTASSKSISQSLPGPHYHVETIMVLSGRYLLYK